MVVDIAVAIAVKETTLAFVTAATICNTVAVKEMAVKEAALAF